MQPQLAFSRLLHRMDLRPEVVGAQKVVRDAQASGRILL
jgi:hypothetical protein